MCRSIKTLFNFEPETTHKEVRDASLQFVRKISGYHTPSATNRAAFDQAVEEVYQAAHRLLHELETGAPPRDRETEAAKAKARSADRFGRVPA